MKGDLLSKLQNRKLTVKTKNRGHHKGMRQSRTIGSSFEFSDYRGYQIGDDIRQIDWNVYGRTEKYYIKRFLDEQEISVALFLDCTASMLFDGKKWNLAKGLAASFSFVTVVNDDRLNFVPVGMDLPPLSRKGASFSKQIYYQITSLENDQKTNDFSEQLAKIPLKNQQLAIVITDGLEPLESFAGLFKRLAKRYKQIRFLQVLSVEESEPTYSGDYRLIDSEDESMVNVSLSKRVLTLYHDRLVKHNEYLELLCRKYGISYMQVTSKEDLTTILFSRVLKSGWLE